MPRPDPPHGAHTDRGGDRRRAARRLWSALAPLRPVLIVTGLVLAYYLLPLDKEVTGDTVALLVLGLGAVLALFVWEIREIERSSRPRLRAGETLVSVLSLFLLVFATAYYLLEQAEGGSFSEPLTRTDSLYFTLATFSTVGFGDITARSQLARIVTMAQMTGGLLLVGVAVRLVVDTVQSALRRREAASGGSGRSDDGAGGGTGEGAPGPAGPGDPGP